MLPSDMLLKPLNQVIEGFNDKIIVNTSGFELGKQALLQGQIQRSPSVSQKPTPKTASARAPVRSRVHTLDDHRDEVTSVIFAVGGLALFAIWWIH